MHIFLKMRKLGWDKTTMKILIFRFQHIKLTYAADTSAFQSARLGILQPEGITGFYQLVRGLERPLDAFLVCLLPP